MKAVGIHVFAGGFTMGVKKVFNVDHQLEVHNFGLETAAERCGIQPINSPAEEWPNIDAEFAFGNPRCTGFSCVTAGLSEGTHGAWSYPTRDIHELMKYAIGKFDIIVWESVQQAYTVGRELLDYLRDEYCVPNNYRIAHVFLNAASFGNAQRRKRYFFVAYRNDRNFNITPPRITHYHPTVYDAIWNVRNNPTNEGQLTGRDYSYDENSYMKRTDHDVACYSLLPNGWCMNRLGKYAANLLPEHYKIMWDYRTSDMPFSMHSVQRISWMLPMPTMTSSAGRFLHPDHDRPLTVGELSTLMGWDCIPVGSNPIAQLAKGVCPALGTWLAEQARDYLQNKWGSDDWESEYDAGKCQWVGRSTHGEIEKVFKLTEYHGRNFDEDRYEPEAREIKPRLRLDGNTWVPAR